jgi:transcriptional regulator with XRE-family HTH domain
VSEQSESERFRHRRLALGLSRAGLARATGIPAGRIKRWETKWPGDAESAAAIVELDRHAIRQGAGTEQEFQNWLATVIVLDIEGRPTLVHEQDLRLPYALGIKCHRRRICDIMRDVEARQSARE